MSVCNKSDEEHAQNIQLANIYVCIGCPAILTNIVTLIIGIKSPKLRWNWTFFLCLAIGDLLYALTVASSGILRLIYLESCYYYTKISPVDCLRYPFVWGYWIAETLISMFTFSISLERLAAVNFPLWYKKVWVITIRPPLIGCIFGYALLLGGVGGIIAAVRDQNGTIEAQCGGSSVASADYVIAWRGMVPVLGTLSTIASISAVLRGIKILHANSDHFRLVRTGCMVCITNLFLNVIPMSISVFVTGFHYDSLAKSVPNYRYFNIMFYSNSLVSFFVYLLFNYDFRKAFLSLITFGRYPVNSNVNHGQRLSVVPRHHQGPSSPKIIISHHI